MLNGPELILSSIARDLGALETVKMIDEKYHPLDEEISYINFEVWLVLPINFTARGFQNQN